MNTRVDRPPYVAQRPAVPELLYDGQCSICIRWATRWARIAGRRLRLRPLQEAETVYPEIREQLRQAVHLVEPDGRVTRGAEAILRSLAWARAIRSPSWMYEHCALARWMLDGLYRWVAAHRCSLPVPAPDIRSRPEGQRSGRTRECP